jgi:hypothetical protein
MEAAESRKAGRAPHAAGVKDVEQVARVPTDATVTVALTRYPRVARLILKAIWATPLPSAVAEFVVVVLLKGAVAETLEAAVRA